MFSATFKYLSSLILQINKLTNVFCHCKFLIFSKEGNSYQKGPGTETGNTIYVRGFDRNADVNEVCFGAFNSVFVLFLRCTDMQCFMSCR